MASSPPAVAPQPPEATTDSAENSAELTDPAQRVALMETARTTGKRLINNCFKVIAGSSCKTDKSVNDWQRRCGQFFNTISEYEILVGVVGETGKGKSSLINQLLGQDVSVTSHGKACTAAVCVFAWNSSDDPEKNFQAKITFKSYVTVENDLNGYLEEREDLQRFLDDPDYRSDPDVKARNVDLKKFEDSIRAWSGLTVKDLEKAMSAHQIIEMSKHPALKLKPGDEEAKYKQYTDVIAAPKLTEFKKQLKRFIDGSSKNRPTDLDAQKDWLLVDLVEVHVKSDLLRDNIKLVDFPGTADAVVARSGAGRGYEWKLDLRIVAMDATRGIDSKGASDHLLPRSEMVDMELDNTLGPESLAVAVNKIDDISIDNPTEHWPDNESIEEASAVLDDLHGKIREIKDIISECQNDGSDNEATEDDDTESKKRRHSGGPSDQLAEYRRQQNILEAEQREAESRLKRLCIDARNSQLKDSVNETLQRARITEPEDDSPCANVFPTSCEAHKKLKNHGTADGFTDLESTGVPALRRWIVQSTLPKRERLAQGHLQELHILLDAVDGWTQNVVISENLLLPADQLEPLKQLLAGKIDELSALVKKKVRDKLLTSLSNLTPLRETHIGKRDKEISSDHAAIEKSAKNLDMAASKWHLKFPGTTDPKKMHYLTYKACVRKCGGRFTTSVNPRPTYHWMGNVLEAFWRPCIGRWQKEYHDKLPRIEKIAASTTRSLFNDFAHDLKNNEEIPGLLRNVLSQNMYLLDHIVEAYVNDINQNIQSFKSSSRDVRLEAEKVLCEHMQPGFEQARNVSGRGAFERTMAIMMDHVAQTKDSMFKSARDHTEASLHKLAKQSAKNIQDSWGTTKGSGGCVAKRMRGLLEQMAKGCCSSPRGARSVSLDRGIGAEDVTKDGIQDIVKEWRQYWASVKPQLPEPKAGQTFDDLEREEQQQKELQKAAKASKNAKAKKGTAKKAAKGAGTGKVAVKTEPDLAPGGAGHNGDEESVTDAGDVARVVVKKEDTSMD